MFVLTFSPLGEKVNTNMALIHQQVKKSTLGKIVNNCLFKILVRTMRNIPQRDELGYSALHHAAIGGLREVSPLFTCSH